MTIRHSIIIPTHNRALCLERAIRSVFRQRGVRDLELIIVDDGSTDNTHDVVDSLRMNAPNHMQFHYLHIPHSGVSTARNHGVESAHGEWIHFLDSDDEWLETKISQQIEFLEKNPEIRIVQSEEIWIRSGVRVNPKNKHKKPQGYIFPQSLELCCITPSSVCIHRNLWSLVGSFDPELFACEDYDYWLRVSSVENVGLVSDYGLIRYGGHSDQLSAKYPVMDRFRVYSILKNGRDWTGTQQNLALNWMSHRLEIIQNGFSKRKKDSQILEQIQNWVKTNRDFPQLASDSRGLVGPKRELASWQFSNEEFAHWKGFLFSNTEWL